VGYVNGCENVLLFPLESQNQPTVLPQIQISPEVCTATGTSDGSVHLVFTQGPVTGQYRVMGVNEGAFLSGELENDTSLTIPLPSGAYLLDLNLEGCVYPVQRINVPSKSLVSFE